MVKPPFGVETVGESDDEEATADGEPEGEGGGDGSELGFRHESATKLPHQRRLDNQPQMLDHETHSRCRWERVGFESSSTEPRRTGLPRAKGRTSVGELSGRRRSSSARLKTQGRTCGMPSTSSLEVSVLVLDLPEAFFCEGEGG